MFHSRKGRRFGKSYRSPRPSVSAAASPPLLEALEPRLLLSGVTLITHGYQANDTPPPWLEQMAYAVADRAGSDTTIFKVRIEHTTEEGLHISSAERLRGAPMDDAHQSAEAVVLLDWADASFWSLFGGADHSTIDVAGAVLPVFLSIEMAIGISRPLAELPVHLIGHSRGGSLVSALSAYLAAAGIWVDHQTTLDPHPVTGDAPALVFDNVLFADNYYETWNVAAGSAVSGAHNILHNSLLGGHGSFDGGDHADIHAYYHGTVAPNENTDGTIAIPEDWYQYSNTGPRESVGFAWSRLGGKARPSGGWWETADRVSAVRGDELWDNVYLHTSAQMSVVQGSDVPMYLMFEDRNHDAEITLGFDVDTSPYNGWFETSTVSGSTSSITMDERAEFDASLPTDNLAPGEYRAFARITNGTNTRYYYASSPITITAATPVVSISEATASIEEDGSGSFTLQRTHTTDPISVGLTLGGDAVYGEDYQLRVGGVTLTQPIVPFDAGVSQVQVEILPNDDAQDEPQESITIGVAAGTGYIVSAENQTSTQIQDNDLPSLTISPSVSSIAEHQGGLAVTIHRSGLTDLPLAVDLALGGSASLGADYRLQVNGVELSEPLVTIPAGASELTLDVIVIDDVVFERDDETVLIQAVPSDAYTIAGSGQQASLNIFSNDSAPSAQIEGDEAGESDGSLDFLVSLSNPSDSEIKLFVAMGRGKKYSATHIADYHYPSTVVVTFAPGQFQQIVSLPVVSDNIAEANETVQVRLTVPGWERKNVKLDRSKSRVYGTIIDDDAPTVTIGDVTVIEGSRGSTTALVTVELSQPSTVPVQMRYATQDGTATMADRDYGRKSGKLTIRPGRTSAVIKLKVSADKRLESDESFMVDLLDLVNAIAGDMHAMVQIDDDEPIPAPPPSSGGFTGTIGHEPPVGTPMSFDLTRGFDSAKKRPTTTPLIDLLDLVRAL